MTMTRGMIAKQNQNAGKRKSSETTEDNGDSRAWSDLIPDILFSIIFQLGVVDFTAFSGVCKSWRTVALSNRREFMLSRQPMGLRVSTQVAKRKECWLEECGGRKFRTILPRSSGRTCIGLVSGYLILFGRKSGDFRLVNPITRHELFFPACPFHVVSNPEAFKGALVFSPTMSRWVFVVSVRFSKMVSFSLSGKQASWTHLSSEYQICDIIFFKGKIYTLNTGVSLCEVRLNPEPTLIPVKMNNMVESRVIVPDFATLGERLFVTGYRSNGPYGSLEVDFDEMKWVVPTALKEYLSFISILKGGMNTLEFWEEPGNEKQRARFNFFNLVGRNENSGALVTTDMWYFPNKCLDVNLLNE